MASGTGVPPVYFGPASRRSHYNRSTCYRAAPWARFVAPRGNALSSQ
jgi:hypothetical protein